MMAWWRWSSVSLVFVLAACSSSVPSPGTERQPGTPLLKPFSSYMSQQSARSASPDANWAASESNEAAPRGDCPVRDFRTIVTKGWVDRGVRGELTLVFLNDALFSTILYPDLVGLYLKKLAADGYALDPDAEDAKAHRIEPRTDLDSAVDAEDRTYVRWQDAALAAEDESWITACS